MKQFAQLDEQLEFKSEMMGDAIDDAVAEDGDEQEQEEILGKVFDELGFQFDREVPNAPSKDIAAPKPVGVEVVITNVLILVCMHNKIFLCKYFFTIKRIHVYIL